MTSVQSKSPPRVWFVTGCSSGFGRLFISAITQRGDKVIATARDLTSLSDYANAGNVRLLQLDITAPREVLKETVAKAISIFGQIDVLVNNAGYVASGVWEECDQSKILDQFDTNVFGPLNLTGAVLPYMRSRGSGSIVFMSSVAGWMGVAVGGPYSASKFAIEGAAESLQREVAQFGVDVHIAVLGQFRTGILGLNKRKSERSMGSVREYDAIVESFQSRLERTDGTQPGDPSQAVERLVDLVHRQGYFSGKKGLPLRVVLGSDAMGIVRNKCQRILNDLEEQEELARSTDFLDTETVPPYG